MADSSLIYVKSFHGKARAQRAFPTRRLLIALIVIFATISFWTLHGPFRPGDRTSLGLRTHTFWSAGLTNAVVIAVLAYAAFDALRALRTGGALSVGRSQKTRFTVPANDTVRIGPIQTSPRTGLLINLDCTSAPAELIGIELALAPLGDQDVTRQEAVSFTGRSLAWNAERIDDELLLPPTQASEHDLCIRTSCEREGPIALRVSWQITRTGSVRKKSSA